MREIEREDEEGREGRGRRNPIAHDGNERERKKRSPSPPYMRTQAHGIEGEREKE